MDEKIFKGKRKWIIIVCIVLSFSLSIAVSSILTYGSQKLVTSVVRIVFTLVLIVLVYKGYEWARWILGFLLLLSSLAGVFSLIAVLAQPSWGALFIAVMIIAYGVSGLMLLSSDDISTYVKSQRDVKLYDI